MISKERFLKEGKEPFEAFEFLKDHRRQAFTLAEIGQAMKITKGESFWEDLAGLFPLLHKLDIDLKDGRVEARLVNGETYYAWRRTLKLGVSACK